MFEGAAAFLQQYFIEPIIHGTGYNAYNTAAYAIIFALVALFVYWLLKHYKISIDMHFLAGVLPYIVLGSLLRVLQDAGITHTYVFVTPLVFIFVLLLCLDFLALSRVLQRWLKQPTDDYWKTWALLGTGSCLIAIVPLTVRNLYGGILIASIFIGWLVLFLAIKKFAKLKILSWENTTILLAHVFDATTTFVSLQFFPYTEQHVIANVVIDIFGPVGMYILKIPVILLVLYVLDRELPDKLQTHLETKLETKSYTQERMFIKLAILVLGLGPGLRNALRLVLGV